MASRNPGPRLWWTLMIQGMMALVRGSSWKCMLIGSVPFRRRAEPGQDVYAEIPANDSVSHRRHPGDALVGIRRQLREVDPAGCFRERTQSAGLPDGGVGLS